MRVYIGSIVHETNRFSPVPTTQADYRYFATGYEDLIQASRAAGCAVVEGMCARAAPSAPTKQADFESLRDQLASEISAAGQLDLILLSLHGAQVAEDCEDCEGDIVQAVRAAVGDSICIGVLLDLHASISPKLLELATVVCSIKEYPHTDFPETAGQLVDLCLGSVSGKLRPVTAFVPLPLFTLWHTPRYPGKALVDRARQLELNGDVLHISLVHGFPWSDVADAGAAVMVITNNDRDTASRLAAEFAAALWDIRDADLHHYSSIEQSLDQVQASPRPEKPHIIADAADNPGAGTGSDATWLLREILARSMSGVALALFHDPLLLEELVQAGKGARVEIRLGGKSGELAGPAVTGSAEVLCINRDASIDAMPGYAPIAVGALAAIGLDGVVVVVGGYREQVFGPRVFTEVGIDPLQQDLLVVKSAQHFYTAFAPLAANVIYTIPAPRLFPALA
jgi:microcystin degradation protein MlrC